MLTTIDDALARSGGALTRADLIGYVGRYCLDNEIRRGHLVRLAPQIYARPWSTDDPDVWDVAAVRYASPGAALSHLSAIRRLGLLPIVANDVHVTVSPASRGSRGTVAVNAGSRQIVVHRSATALPVESSSWVPCVSKPVAIVQAWPLLSASERRAPLIRGCRRGAIRTSQVRACLDSGRRCKGKSELLATLDLIDAGCESELEIWGYRSVFTTSELGSGVWQYRIRASGQLYRIDLGYPDARLAVELDGRAYHASPQQWDRDIARDTALAKLGWQTIRLSHRRLTTDVAGCRRDVAAVLKQRL